MIPLADLKLALRVSHATDDAHITSLEERAVAYVERKTGRSYTAGNATEYVRGADDGVLYLGGPASAVVSVTQRAYPGAEETVIVEAADDGFDLRGTKLVRSGGYFWSSAYEYEVEYTRDVTPPDDILEAVEGLVSLWYNVRLPVALGTVAPPVPNHVASILAAHRRLRV